MAKEQKKGTTRRFGARYGIRVRANIDAVEAMQKENKKCPICRKEGSITRLAAGIFHCKRCNNKLTGKAYFLSSSANLKRTEQGKLVIDVGEPEIPLEAEEESEETTYREKKKKQVYEQESLAAEE